MIIYGTIYPSYPMGPYALWVACNCDTGTFVVQLRKGDHTIYEDLCLANVEAMIKELLKSRT